MNGPLRKWVSRFAPELAPESAFLRFCIVGAVNTGVTFVTYQALLFALTPAPSWVLSSGLGIALSFAGNSRYTFRMRPTANRVLPYAALYGTTLVAGVALLETFIALGIHPRLAAIGVIACMLPVNFVGARFILARSASEGTRPS